MKMKRIRNILVSLLCLCLLLSSALVVAYAEAPVFTIDADGVITGCSNVTGGVIEIPEMVDGVQVTGIGADVFKYMTQITGVTIPEGIQTIGSTAFMGCTGLTSITLPSSVTTIGSYAFYGCSSLASINIPEGVTKIEDDTFDGCSALTSLTIPSSVTYIAMYAIKGCDNLTSINLPDNVTLDMYAIYECNSLQTLTIPAGLQLSTWYQIGFCDSLETLIFADGATVLPVEFVTGCPNINNIVVPDSVDTINANFSAYTDISSAVIHYLGTPEQWNNITINDGGSDSLINTSAPHFIVSENKPSTCKDHGYENKLVCSSDGCGYVYSNGTTLPLSEEHAEMDPATGECTLCGEMIAVAKFEDANGTTYVSEQTLEEPFLQYRNGTFTVLRNVFVKQLVLWGGTFDLNGCTVTGCLDVRNTVTVQDGVGGGSLQSDDILPSVLVNGNVIVKSGSFLGKNDDVGFRYTTTDGYIDFTQNDTPDAYSILFYWASNGDLYQRVRLPAGYVLLTTDNNVIGKNEETEPNTVFKIGTCPNHIPAYTSSGDTITEVCAQCRTELGTLKVSAAGGIYNGVPFAATVTGTGTLENVQDFDMVYMQGSKVQPYAPIKSGTYTASMTYEGKTATTTYTIDPKKLTPDAVTADKVYDGTTTAAVTIGQASGLVGSDEVRESATAAFRDANVGENKPVDVIYTLSGADAGNYVIDPVVLYADITPAPLTVTAKDQTITHGGAIVTTAYTVEGLVNGQKAIVTLTPSTDKITANGIITPSVKVTDAGGADVTANYKATFVPGKLVIKPNTAEIDDLTVANVNYADEDAIQAVLDALEDAESTEPEWAAIEEKCEKLLERIEESLTALRTEAVQNTLGVTPENVKISQKAEIQSAIKTIEAALTTYGGNYSEADKKELQDQVALLKASLEVIAKLEAEQETTAPTEPETTPEPTVPETTTPATKPTSPVPTTGDETNLLLWSVILIVTACTAVLLTKKSRSV